MSDPVISLSGDTLLPDGTVADRRITIDGDTIVDVGDPLPADHRVASGELIAPGLIDCQINGAFGFDFTTDPESIREVAARLPEVGVTAFVPTVITCDPDVLPRASKAVVADSHGARSLGLHLEGPVISPVKRGAHPARWIREAASFTAEVAQLDDVRIVTFDPEGDEGHELLDALVADGIVAGLGHSDASYEMAARCFERGARLTTHLFNAMAPLDHREPGVIGATLAAPDVYASIIADGTHLHPAVLTALWSLLGPDRLVLVSDAIAAAGLGDGTHLLGEVEVTVSDGVARNDAGDLAGSTQLLVDGVCCLAQAIDRPIATVWRAASTTPAALLGEKTLGQVAPGRRADLTVIDDHGRCAMTLVGGRPVFSAA